MLRAVLKVTDGETGKTPSAEGASTQELIKIEPRCEHCNAENKYNEQATPRLLPGDSFHGSWTQNLRVHRNGLIFEASRKVDNKDCVLSGTTVQTRQLSPGLLGD